MIDLIVFETNIYRVQRQGMPLSTFTAEVEHLLGIYMRTGLVQMLQVRSYWELSSPYLSHFALTKDVRQVGLCRPLAFLGSEAEPVQAVQRWFHIYQMFEV